ncbi:MAG: class I SAM-dependent methyltransferase [Anaerolineales bacterium]|nr:class I SAM-dependent methyltransferase [Anaerolineales bacterium]
MGIDRSRRVTFEETADLYNEVRPEYPDQLAEDIICLSALPLEGHILEVGCGAGNATSAFAKRGYRLLGIELGERLAAYARQRCRDFPNTVIVQSAFEDFELTPHTFDLAVSADAFHWIQPEVGYPKLIHALKPTGSIALFWQIEATLQNDRSRALDETLRKRLPDENRLGADLKLAWVENVIRGNFREYCGIEETIVRTYDWIETYNAETFIKLMQTYSSLCGLDDESRAALHADVRNAIANFGGSVQYPYRAALFFARVKS